MDAYNVAFRIPNLLRDLFAEGAMSAALVPVFTKTRKLEGDARAFRVAGLVFRFLGIFIGLLTLIGVLFSEQLVSLYASQFQHTEGKFELAVTLTKIMFPFFPLVCVAAAFMAVLNALGAFFLPAFSSALFNLVSIIFGVGLSQLMARYPEWGMHPIEGMAYGVVAGGFVQAFCQLPVLYKKGYRFSQKKPEEPVWYKDPALRQMLFLMLPGMIGLAATQINLLVNTVLASSQGEGAVSWLNYAFRLMQFPIGIFGVSLAQATLPRVSELWVTKDFVGIQNTLTRSLRLVFAVNFPAAAGLGFLSIPIIQLIFQHGRFEWKDTYATAFALSMYSLGLVAYSAVKVLVPACYAFGATRIAVTSSLLTVVLNIFLNLGFIQIMGFAGLALGTSLAATFNAVFLFVYLQKLIRKSGGNLDLSPILRGLLAHLGVALLMGISVYLVWGKFFYSETPNFGERVFQVGTLVTLGVVLTLVLGKIFKLSETNEVFTLLRRKILSRMGQ